MRSHETRPSSVPPKLELLGGTVSTAVPPVKTLEGTVPPCPPMIYATVRTRTRLVLKTKPTTEAVAYLHPSHH